MGLRGKLPAEHHPTAGFAAGLPRMPSDLSKEAKEIWKFVCDQIPEERSSPADKLALIGLSRWFVQWAALMKELEADRVDRHLQRQATAAWQMVDQQLRQFGMTMVSRSRIPTKKDTEKKSDNPILKIAEMRNKRKPG